MKEGYDNMIQNAMNVKSAAETVYSWVAKSLNKFLRLVHSQSHHPSDEVKEHIRRFVEISIKPGLYNTLAVSFPSK